MVRALRTGTDALGARAVEDRDEPRDAAFDDLFVDDVGLVEADERHRSRACSRPSPRARGGPAVPCLLRRDSFVRGHGVGGVWSPGTTGSTALATGLSPDRARAATPPPSTATTAPPATNALPREVSATVRGTSWGPVVRSEPCVRAGHVEGPRRDPLRMLPADSRAPQTPGRRIRRHERHQSSSSRRIRSAIGGWVENSRSMVVVLLPLEAGGLVEPQVGGGVVGRVHRRRRGRQLLATPRSGPADSA